MFGLTHEIVSFDLLVVHVIGLEGERMDMGTVNIGKGEGEWKYFFFGIDLVQYGTNALLLCRDIGGNLFHLYVLVSSLCLLMQ